MSFPVAANDGTELGYPLINSQVSSNPLEKETFTNNVKKNDSNNNTTTGENEKKNSESFITQPEFLSQVNNINNEFGQEHINEDETEENIQKKKEKEEEEKKKKQAKFYKLLLWFILFICLLILLYITLKKLKK